MNLQDYFSFSEDTMMSLLQDLYQQFIQNKSTQYLILEGDAKIYEILQSIKLEYGEDLSWLILYSGDWHMLMNYQSALMKPYFDAGLKSLAEAVGFQWQQQNNVANSRDTSFYHRSVGSIV